MTQQEKLMALSIIVGDSESYEVLSTYLDLAKSKIIARAYPYAAEIKEMPSKYESLQIEIAAYMINKRGAEGQLSHSENGISRTYENADIPESMLKTIVPYCGIIRE